MVERCNLTHLAEINAFMSEWEGENLVRIRGLLKDPLSHILSHRDKSIYFILEAKSPKVAAIHLYCDKASRGKKMVDFINEAREWIKSSTDFKFIFNYTEDFQARMIMKCCGSKDIGVYRGSTVFKQVIDREV